MTQRKPGDYVVNAELTTEQIERFVEDCVAAGAQAAHIEEVSRQDLVGWCKSMGVRPRNVIFCGITYANNVTHEYKTQPNHPDLPTVLRECAEHLEAGRDPFRQLEVHDGGGWRQSLNYMELAACAVNGNVRRKPTHRTPTEDDVGRLVMVRSRVTDKWAGPYVLEATTADIGHPFQACHRQHWPDAKLYQGPTRPNWIEHDGRGRPDGVEPDALILYQNRAGSISADRDLTWWHEDDAHDVVKYAIIEP